MFIIAHGSMLWNKDVRPCTGTRHCDNALSVRFASLANNDGIIKLIDEANKTGVRIDEYTSRGE